MAKGSMSRLGRQLRSDDGRLGAVEALESIDSFEPEVADGIVDDLVDALETESSAYTLLRLLGVLEQLAQDSPRVASEATPVIVERLDDAIQGLEGDEVLQNREVGHETEILEAILDGTSPEEVRFDIEYEDVREIIRNGGIEHRVIAYRILGRAATGGAVRILLQDFSHELGTVIEARETALANACSLVTTSLGASGPLSRVATIDAFSELWVAGRIAPDRAQVDTVRKETFTALETVDEQQRETLLPAIERLARRDQNTAEAIVSEALERLRANQATRQLMWDVLLACAEGAPTVVLDHGDEIATELEGDTSTDPRSALDVVKVASRGVDSVPAILASPILGMIDAEHVETSKHAVETAGTMGFYPVPDPLIELADQGHPSLSRVASQAREKLRQNRSTPTFVSDFRSGGLETSLFDGDPGDLHLKVRTDGGSWTDLSLGQFREGVVETTVRRLDQGENVPMVYPHYEPSDIVVLTLALVLEAPEDDVQVGLYSPGSRTHWGTKGEIRTKLREFGLADVSGEVISAVPVPEIVPDAYVSEGRVKDNSEGDGPGRIVLTKAVPELIEVSDIDVALLNLTSRTRMNIREKIEEFEREVPEADVVSAYSYYTRNETEGRPRYGPPSGLESTPTVPGPDLFDPLADQTDTRRERAVQTDRHGTSDSDGRTESIEVFGVDDWQTGDDDVRSLNREKTIRIDHVDSGELATLFDKLFEESASLFDTDASGAGGLIFSRQMFFERLPIPPDDFDEWVRNRYEEGDRFVPPLIRERIGDVEHKANTVENLTAVQPLNTAQRLLDRIHERLRESNPLFETLQDYILEAKRTGDRLAIFSTSPKNAQLLRDTLVKHDLVSEDELGSAHVSVVSPDESRKMERHERLLVFGSLHPEHAGFYVHPRVDETVVVTYDRTWAEMIDRHASEFVARINEVVGEAGYEPYTEPEVGGDVPREAEEAVTKEETGQEMPKGAPSNGERSDKSKTEILPDAMQSASATEYGEEPGRYERELRRYLVVTADEDHLRFTNRENVLRQSPTSEDDDVHWINPDALSAGDTLVTIPEELKEELWRDHLVSFHDDEIGADDAIERVRTWHDSLNEIWERVTDELNTDGEISKMELHRRIHGWINQENDNFDRVIMTVRTWFESAREADGPIDLLQNPSLVIGPQHASDIMAVGRAFGYEELSQEGEAIQGAMKGLRTINRQEGHKYRDSITRRLDSGERTRVSESASYREVAEIRAIDDDDDERTEDGGATDQLDTDLIPRVKDIVDLAPTSNGELADRWGYDSGSEVFQFLTTNLEEHYERNDGGYIIPTERAKQVANVGSEEQ